MLTAGLRRHHRHVRSCQDWPVRQEAAQVLRQCFGTGVALAGVPGQALEHHRFEVAWNVRFDLPRRGRRLVQHTLDQPSPVAVLEGRLQGQHLVQRGAQGVHVALGQRAALKPLRRHEPQRADDVPGVRQLVGALGLGQPEVRDPNRPLVVQQEIGRLDVAMEHTVAVGIGQRFGHLQPQLGHAPVIPPLRVAPRQGCRLRLARRRSLDRWLDRGREPSRQQALRDARRRSRQRRDLPGPAKTLQVVQDAVESLTLDKLHGVKRDAVALADAEDRNDVGVVQTGPGPCLATKPLAEGRVEQRGGRQHLEGNVPAQGHLLGLVDHPHAAAAQFANQEVIA